MKVVTTNGTTLQASVFEAGGERPLTEDEAEARCKQANADAERLGIETRYEVKEA